MLCVVLQARVSFSLMKPQWICLLLPVGQYWMQTLRAALAASNSIISEYAPGVATDFVSIARGRIGSWRMPPPESSEDGCASGGPPSSTPNIPREVARKRQFPPPMSDRDAQSTRLMGQGSKSWISNSRTFLGRRQNFSRTFYGASSAHFSYNTINRGIYQLHKNWYFDILGWYIQVHT